MHFNNTGYQQMTLHTMSKDREAKATELLYRYLMTEYALEREGFKPISLDDFNEQFKKLGFKFNRRQPYNDGLYEVSNLDETKWYEIQV